MRDFLRFLFLLILILALIVVGVSYYFIHFARAPIYGRAGAQGPVEVLFEIHPGETTAQIAGRLESEGLILNALVFQGYTKLRGMDRRLEAGRYMLRSDMTTDQILETLTNAPAVEEITFTIREGLRLEEMADSLNQQRVVSVEEFMAALKKPYNYAFLADRPPETSLEGYLFPDTYTVPRAYTATQIIDFILSNFDQKFDAGMREAALQQKLTIHQVVILASIVEREAITDTERPIIASVYLNRLAAGMPLDADPTVQYAIGYSKNQARWWPALYFDELGVTTLADIDSPYNTYRNPGLPPGPICSPGLASLKAVVQPAQTDYYYFVAKGDGTGEHAFAKTLEEHNANVAKYQH